MTVSELIEILQKFKPETEVTVYDRDFCENAKIDVVQMLGDVLEIQYNN